MVIAIVDDEYLPAEGLSRFVQSMGHDTRVFQRAEAALSALKTERIDLVISDITMPGMDGLEFVAAAFEQRLPVQFILVSGVDEVARSINSMELGVLDFLTKPVDTRELGRIITEYEDARSTETFALSETGDAGLFSHRMRNVYRKLRKLQDFPQIPVLIQGETGTGKEVLARYLHHHNEHVGGPFIALNCSALSATLFEAELFGYEAGAFTGADRRGKPGKIKLAAGGTLFLDEITELVPSLQAKLLRVLQERTFFPVAGTAEERVETRVVCATNEDVEALIQRGAFREDLFYRLNVCRAVLPPLRDRREEIVPLVWMFLRKFSEEFGHEFTAVEPQAMTMLERHDWPGNVREMRNVLTNIAIFEDGHRVTGEMVRRHLGAASPAADGEPGGSNERPRAGSAGPVSQAAEPPPADGAESESAGGRASASPTEHAPRLPVDEPFVLPEQPFDLDAFSRRVVAQALTRFGGNKSEAARFLGLSRTQLYGRYRDVEPDSDH